VQATQSWIAFVGLVESPFGLFLIGGCPAKTTNRSPIRVLSAYRYFVNASPLSRMSPPERGAKPVSQASEAGS
jgi:hypothetical protein